MYVLDPERDEGLQMLPQLLRMHTKPLATDRVSP